MEVSKRDGTLVSFDPARIENALSKAFKNTGEVEDSFILAESSFLQQCVRNQLVGNTVSVEEIQDRIEELLMNKGYYQTAKAYILYRSKHQEIRKLERGEIDGIKLMSSYIDASDWRVKENSTVTHNLGGLILSNSGAVTANYWLEHIYDEEVAEAHRSAAMHIHDLSMLAGYCAGWSLKQIIQEGLGGVSGRITSSPARHLSTLCNQMVNFLGIMQNEWAGAQALSSFDTYLAPFVKIDNLTYKQTKQCIQSFIYGVNTPSRWGCQSPFTNITLDWTVPEDLSELNCLVGGRELDFCYKDCQEEMNMVNKAFIEVMLEGDANGRGFQYPIPTYSITKDFDWGNSENNRLLFEMTAKYGTPYFSNYLNSDMKPSDVRSMCCRLRLDLRELRKKSGGYFGSGESTGSVGVVTLNLPRLGYLSKNREDFYHKLDKLMDIAARSLDTKRRVITGLLKDDMYPYTKHYLGDFHNHFSTIGLVGMNECIRNISWIYATNIAEDEGRLFAEAVLNHMRERLSDYQEQYGDLFNLEATPAESTSYRLAKHDREQFPNIEAAGTEGAPYYTNSSQLPVNYTTDVFEALDHQDPLQILYTSGTVFHAFLGERLPDWRSAANLVKKIAEGYKLPYYTLSPTYSVCKEHGYIPGEVYTCPYCGKVTEVYSRITGYYRPVSNWNKGKEQEFKERSTYDVDSLPLQKGSIKLKEEAGDTKETTKGLSTITLFKTSTCPNCRTAKIMLDSSKIPYDEIYADKQPELAKKFNIMSAPTLIVPNDTGYDRLVGVGQIKGYIASR